MSLQKASLSERRPFLYKEKGFVMADEKIFTVPLNEAYKKARVRRSPYAARIVKDFIKKHTKADEVKLGENLNKKLWERGTKKPPRRVRIKAVMEGKTAKVELLGFEYKEFRTAQKTERKGMKDKLLERLGPKALQKAEEEKMADEGKTSQEVREEKTAEEKKD